MKLNGTKITKIEHFDIKTVRKLLDEGQKMLRLNPSQLDNTEKALLIAAEHAVNLIEFFGTRSSKDGHTARVTLEADDMSDLAAALASNYHIGLLSDMDKRDWDLMMIDKTASLLLFEIWNLYHMELDEAELADAEDDGKQYEAAMHLEYGADITTGREHFRKIGIELVNENDPTDTWYFDALRLGREFVSQDILNAGGVFAVDAPYFSYRVGCALTAEGKDILEAPVPMRIQLAGQLKE